MVKNRSFVTLMLTLVALAVVATGCGGGGAGGGGEQKAETAAPEPAPAAQPAGPTGTVTGTVSYTNGDPDTQIKMDADPVCASLHPEAIETETVIAEGGKLANAFVYVKSGLTGSFSPPDSAQTLDQKGCRYFPHVSGIQVGQKLVIKNSDPTLHNVHALPKNNQEFNQGQPFQNMELEKTFDTAEVMVRFKCDVHPWMGAYMGVLDHPFFAVSAVDGSFTIDGLPPGEYALEAWHETLGSRSATVTVASDTVSAASFEFAPAG
ncbi:MAG: hypothetical protein OES47_10680 [Acidobacteriota bacterium]|nr:hypothetical protein [Acidobacteriota bacterium]